MVLQLAKTTPYLSGQQRIDIELKKDSGYISTGNIHVVPLSDNIIYNENDKRSAFNYSHEDNIKYLFSQTQDTFWSDVKCRKDTLYYSDHYIDLYDHTYQCGARRIRYSRYNKQFSYLMTIWLDQPWSSDLCARITVWPAIDNPQHFVSRRLLKFSGELQNYLYNYTKNVSSELLNINSDRKDATIKGLNAPAGVDNDVDVSYIYNNILSRERPLIEFDSMLCELFSANKMIAKQLINFNFVFNINDIVAAGSSFLTCNNFTVEFEFGRLDNNLFTPFDFKDIYTNYNYIPSYTLDQNGGSYDVLNEHNVLDYLDDNKCVDFIYVNKTTQPICHWTLVENPNYIYNFYGGFSPYYEGKQVVGSYYGMPRLEGGTYNESLNNIGWCGRTTNIQPNTLISEINRVGVTSNATLIPNFFNDTTIEFPESYWIDWLKYSKPDINSSTMEDLYNDLSSLFSNNVYFEIINQNNSNISGTCNRDVIIENNTYKGYINTDSVNHNVLFCISSYNTISQDNAIDLFTIKRFKDLDIAIQGDQELTSLIKYIQILISNPVPPVKFVFDKGIIPVQANPKNVNTTEIKYIKANENTYNYVYRYTDHLQPLFIDCIDNKNSVILYNSEWKCNSFEDVDEKLVQTYNDGIISNEEPVYPSVGYFPLSIISEYSSSNSENTHYFSAPTEYSNLDEYVWFNKSSICVLPSKVNIMIQLNSSISQQAILERVEDELENYLIDQGAHFKDFEYNILPLYKYDIDFEYSGVIEDDVENVNLINYYITYTLR